MGGGGRGGGEKGEGRGRGREQRRKGGGEKERGEGGGVPSVVPKNENTNLDKRKIRSDPRSGNARDPRVFKEKKMENNARGRKTTFLLFKNGPGRSVCEWETGRAKKKKGCIQTLEDTTVAFSPPVNSTSRHETRDTSSMKPSPGAFPPGYRHRNRWGASNLKSTNRECRGHGARSQGRLYGE